MKIACLLGSLNRGGAEVLMLDVIQNASKANFEMILIHRKTGQLLENYRQSNVPLIQLKPERKNYLQYFVSLRKQLKKHNVQIVHAHQPLDAIYAQMACLFSKIKVVLTFHGFPGNGFYGTCLNFIAIGSSDSVVFVSKYQKEFYQKKYKIKNKSKLNVVYNGVNFNKFENFPFHSIREELKIPNNVMLMGTIGNFVRGRDQMTICRFLNLLKQQNVSFHFLFIGKKNDSESRRYDDCVKYCRENNLCNSTSFLGNRSDIPNILSQLSVFIYSSDHDTFGIAVIEAISAGCTVFINDWEVMKEISNQGELATLYKTKDENNLLLSFMSFLQKEEIGDNKARKASIIVKERFSIEKHIGELEKLYANLLVSSSC